MFNIMSEGTIKICSNHPEYPVPLIWTFAFRSAEYWCPYCGYISGMFGAGENVESSALLEERLKKYKEKSEYFLRAKGRQDCVETEYQGKWIKPEDLPESEQEKDVEIIKNWKYEEAV